MTGITIALWAVLGAQFVLLLAIIRRLGGLTEIIQVHRERAGLDQLLGTRLPPLRSRLANGVPGGGQARRLGFAEGTLVVFAAPRCVASRRLLRGLQGRLRSIREAGFPVVVAIPAGPGEVTRILQEFDLSDFVIEVADRHFLRRVSDAIPFAISLGPDGVVDHIGSMDSDAAVYRFGEACGSPAIRDWLRSGPESP